MAEKDKRMSNKKPKKKLDKSNERTKAEKHQEDLLDEGIDESFPASDPPAVFQNRTGTSAART